MNGKQGTKTIVTQIDRLLNQLDNSVYAMPLEILHGATLGQHFRHIFDFYHCIFRGASLGLIDYASRERDPDIELRAGDASQAFRKVVEAVDQLDEEMPLKVAADFLGLANNNRATVVSSVGRELMFAHDHAVHHLAIIRIGLRQVLPHLMVEEELGVAPATLKYRAGENAPRG